MSPLNHTINRCTRASLAFAKLFFWLAAVPTAQAQFLPTLGSTAPLVVERGQSIEVTLIGQHFRMVDTVFVADARGLEASLVRSMPATQPSTAPATQPTMPAFVDTQVHLRLSAPMDAALGDRELRLVSPTGVSAPLHVTVSQYVHVTDIEPNDSPGQAQKIRLPAVITGKMDAAGDADFYRFSARRGERLVFDVYSARAGSRLDPVIVLHDADGKELAPRVDFHGADPTLILEVPADGNYGLEIRDLEFRGGPEFTYRIDSGAIPYIQSLMPMSAQPGQAAKIRPVGVNLEGSEGLPLDLTYAATGPISIRARSSLGFSNDVPFEVSDLPAYVQKGENHAVDVAEKVSFPAEISGCVDRTGAEDFYKFHIDRKQLVTLEVVGRRLGSAIDALLTLRNDKGDAIASSDDSAAAAARITRDLEAGDYLASVRDLTFHGGPDFGYLMRVRPGVSASGQDFAVRFLPDAPRVSRGGNTVVFCDIQRIGGFKGDVTLSVEDLPPGITLSSTVFSANSSDLFTMSAGPDAVIGTFPIRVRATATIDNHVITKLADAVLGDRPVRQAYLTVMAPAPFTIEALAGVSPQRVGQLSAAAGMLAQKLSAPDPALDAAQAKWESKVSTPLVWTALDSATVKSSQGTQFVRQPDGSFLASGKVVDKDTYSVTASIGQSAMTAVRLEVFPDDSLPLKGPGRHEGDGNFVLSKFAATSAPLSDSQKVMPVAFSTARALFEQSGYPAMDAIVPKPDKGWAIFPAVGKANAALFFMKTPVGSADGSVLTFTLDQQFQTHFQIGRFRLSVTSDPDAAEKSAVPANMLAIVQIPAAARSPEQVAGLSTYFRGIDPKSAAQEQRLEIMRGVAAPLAELARLEAMLAAQAPQLDGDRIAWEKRMLAGATWLPLDISQMKSEAGATFTKQQDGSLLVGGVSPLTDVYTLSAASPITEITAIRLEALPDPHLPGNGPGRGDNGNFVLSRLRLSTSPKSGTPAMAAAAVEFRGAEASFQQQGFGVLGALDERDDTGWAVLPNVGIPSEATFFPRQPITIETAAQLTLELDHKYAAAARHTLGRFRIWVTGNMRPELTLILPADVLASLRLAADKRDAAQRVAVANYYRLSIAPAFAPLRQRIDELKNEMANATTHVQYRQGAVPLLIDRTNFEGEIQITLEGFSANRKRPIASSMRFMPARLPGTASSGAFGFTVEPAAELGTRLAVLRAEARISGETYVQYSAAFPLTVAPAR